MRFLKRFKKGEKRKKVIQILLVLTLFLGGFFRFYNLNWDQGHFFHPDERNIAAAVSRISFFDQLNPEFFAYGSLPIYLYRAAGEMMVWLTKNSDWTYQWRLINLIGRNFSAFFATLSIFLSFLLAKRIWNQKVALVSAFLVAFTPFLIQTAHFGVTESMLSFWVLLVALFSLRLFKNPSRSNYCLIGLTWGLSLTTKVSSLSFSSLILTAHLLSHPKLGRPSFKKVSKWLSHNLKLFLILLTASIAFLIFSPYTFLSWNKFQESMNYEGGIVWGKLKVVYVLQFEKTLPYLFQTKNLFWQMGPIAGLGIIGIILLLIIGFKKRHWETVLFLSFPITYFAYVGSWYTKFIRYMAPLLPFLAISAAWLLVSITHYQKKVGKILLGLFCLITFFWATAFFSIYTRESTRITASKWLYQNLPSGSKILQEHWDEGLPIRLKNLPSRKFETEPLTIYEPDNQAKAQYLAEKLSEADYLVINSRRLYGTLINLPEKYPITSRYYQLLFKHQLGYQVINQFTSYPSFFGLEINDDRTEETFQVYDHPKVIVFKNTQKLSDEKIKKILMEN